MNFIAGIALIANNGDEEDAFWVLTIVVEKLCAGIYSKAMMNIQVIPHSKFPFIQIRSTVSS